jgi:hypothetical protein
MTSEEHPYLTAPFRLGINEIRSILQESHISMSPASPFGFISWPQGDDAETKSKSGIGENETLFEAIELLSNPEGRLRISIFDPESTPKVLNLFICKNKIVHAHFDEENYEIGAPALQSDIINRLASQIVAVEPRHRASKPYWNSHIRLASYLWAGSKTAVNKSISSELAIHELERIGIKRDDAIKVLQSMSLVGCVCDNDGELSLENSFGYWMSLFWSRHFLLLEYKMLRGGTIESLSRREKRLLFVGPYGNRCYCESFCSANILAEAGVLGDPAFKDLEKNTIICFRHLTFKDSALKLINRFMLQLDYEDKEKCLHCGGVLSASHACPAIIDAQTSVSAQSVDSGNRDESIHAEEVEVLRENNLVDICPNCRTPKKGRNFCTHCGTKFASI